MSNTAIQEVVVYVTDIGAALDARVAGSVARRVPPKTMISTADSQLGLNGSLVSYMHGREVQLEPAPEMNPSEWDAFLNQRFAGRSWQRWFGKTPTAIYSVVVVFDASPSDVTHGPADAGDIVQIQPAGMRVCPSCQTPLAPGAVLCVRCGIDTRTGKRVGAQGAGGAAGNIAGKAIVRKKKKRRLNRVNWSLGRQRDGWRDAVGRLAIAVPLVGVCWLIWSLVENTPRPEPRQVRHNYDYNPRFRVTCASCGRRVPSNSKVGGRCAKCGVLWTYESY